MILQEYTFRPDADSRSEDNCAEVATRLRNAFKSNEDVLILNEIPVMVEGRKVKVDHVVLHAYGIILINSRSLYGRIEVNYRGEWSRNLQGREVPMENPLELFKHVNRSLRSFLAEHASEVLSMQHGMQRTFDGLPIENLFIQASRSNIQGNGINQSNILFLEQLTQHINRNFNSYKKREFQLFSGNSVFKFLPSDMYATADLLMGNPIDRENYPVSAPTQQESQPVRTGRPVLIKTRRIGPARIIKARDIKPGRRKTNSSNDGR